MPETAIAAAQPAARATSSGDRLRRDQQHASVAPARDHDPAGGTVSVRWSTELAIPVAMAVEPEPAAGEPGRRAAVDARSRPSSLDRRRVCKPPLDVEGMMNDSWRASGRLRHRDRPGARRRWCWRTVDVTYSASPTLSSEDRGSLLPQAAGPTRITLDEGTRG